MSRTALINVCLGGLLLLLIQGGPAYAEVRCGATISEEVTLSKDLSCTTPTAVTVVGPSGQLNLQGYSIDCNTTENAIGIFLVGENGRISNGTVKNCHRGVVAGDNGRHHIIGIISRDHFLAGFITGAFGTLGGSPGNRFINNHTENSPIGFLITGNENYLFNNSSVASERGFVVSQNRNTFTLNASKNNDLGFVIQLGAEKNHFIKNIAEENAFAGFEIEGNRNRLVNNRAIGNGRNMVDVGFRIMDAKENFLAWNESARNTGIGFEIVALFNQSEHNVLRGNLAQNNEQGGIVLQLLAENNTLIENTGQKNGNFDLQDVNPDCDDNRWIDNSFNTADPVECIQ